jgi:thiamine biosynthesis lipoprotein
MPPAKDSPSSHSFDAIGTAWEIRSATALESSVLEEVAGLIDAFDHTWSRFRDDSLVSDIARTSGEYPLPPEAGPLFDFYRSLYDISTGRITPLVGRALEALGYDRTYSLQPEPGPAPRIPSWDEAFSFKDGILSAPKPVLLDIGAAGKGLLVDMVLMHLVRRGHDRVVVDASGDLRRCDAPGSLERVGLENPLNPTLAIGVAEIGSEALGASGVTKRTWATGIHHVLDGVTGLPTRGVLASWVVAPNAMVADGIATALLIMDPAPFAETYDIQWVTMAENGSVRHSDGFRGEIFS